MTPGQAQWVMWLFGAVCGVACGGLAASTLYRSQRLRLRVALGDLVREDTKRWYSTESSGWHGEQREALERARDVLSGKGAE